MSIRPGSKWSINNAINANKNLIFTQNYLSDFYFRSNNSKFLCYWQDLGLLKVTITEHFNLLWVSQPFTKMTTLSSGFIFVSSKFWIVFRKIVTSNRGPFRPQASSLGEKRKKLFWHSICQNFHPIFPNRGTFWSNFFLPDDGNKYAWIFRQLKAGLWGGNMNFFKKILVKSEVFSN